MLAIAQGVPPCSGDHCSKQTVIEHVNEICKANGWPVGAHVLVKGPDGKYCYCTCSCLAFGSPVQAAPGQMRTIETFKLGDPLMACDLNFQWTQRAVSDVAGTDQIGQPNTVFVRWNGGTLTVTADHLFLVDGQYLLTADKLIVGDKLTAPDGSAVAIVELHTGDFFGSFHNVTTNAGTNPSSDPNGHLVNTNGVISGDYALQTQYVAGMLSADVLHAGIHERPVIGSLEYQERFDSADPSEHARSAGVLSEGGDPRENPGRLLIRREVEGPDEIPGLLGYVPRHRRGVLEGLPAYKVSDANRKRLGDYVTTLFGAFYPDIVFRVDWWVGNVNALAVRGGENGKDVVVLHGGLLRVQMLDLPGIALATSFCVAALKAPEEDAENVGKADYNGAASVMRNVWWDLDYVLKMEAAIKEMTEFLSYVPVNFGEKHGPFYPDGLCRVQTYEAALTVEGVPACAQPHPTPGGGAGGNS